MSKYVEVRGVKIGEGVPKICVPIVGKTKEEILAAAKSFEDVALDVVEWRVDWFEGVFDFAQVEDVLKDLRPALGETPILFTYDRRCFPDRMGRSWWTSSDRNFCMQHAVPENQRNRNSTCYDRIFPV